ncbi:TRAP transporter fused permease subunit [Pararhodobacter sp. SW119]|uniref:TRAP transporter permease n=1 Tax=Pararhodobacter sp. SW119 TaxID=2780075 RepID=UPI001ADFF178|nr:TRAP transporter fused permease subunit [Pararhodobacter sp. SW119]
MTSLVLALTWTIRAAIQLAAVALAGLAVYAAAFGVFDVTRFTAITVGLATTIGFLMLSLGESSTLDVGTAEPPRPVPADLPRMALHLALATFSAWALWDWADVMLRQEAFFIRIAPMQFALGWAAIAAIGYLVLRFFGPVMLLVYVAAAVFILLPGDWGGAGVSWTRVANNLWFSTDGVFGRPVEVVSRVVLIFIVFGAVLQASGAGDVLLRMAFAATGRFAGGPAHAAILGSSFFGTLSGSPIANVVSTGVFTIPIIKRAGFTPRFAGAVEAAASTGGQIMPPVMGVVAFLMADVTGIPYLHIITAALIPAILYYLSLFVVVYIEARRLGIEPTRAADLPRITGIDWLRSLAFWVPLGVIIYVLMTGRTAQNAGFYALASALVLCLAFFPGFRDPRRWWSALAEAGRTSALLMIIVAAIGFVIGVINMSGIGLRFAEGVLALADTSLIMALLLVMGACLIMGMGVPTGAAYLLIAIVLGPALQRLGVPLIAAHLFVVYFGVLSVVTPPVALAAFAAAPIAGAKPMETGVEALRLAVAGFVIPFLFVFHHDLLLIVPGFSLAGLAWALALFVVATWMLATALGGWEGRRLALPERLARGAAGLVAIHPDPRLSLPALAATAALVALNARGLRRLALDPTPTRQGGETR